MNPSASPEPDEVDRRGPLAGVRVVELQGIGPAPFAAMVLADLGADVVQVARPGGPQFNVGHRYLERNRRSIVVDLREPEGVDLVRRLVASADVLLEGFRPGVAERLGLGPDDVLGDHPGLVYGRMTGWGQEGPWADRAGHDINYVALTGALDAIGRRGGAPTVPLNLVGDFGGGAMFLAVGVLAALVHSRATGQGQIVDAAMVDGASLLMTMFHDMADLGLHGPARGTNLLDSGAWFYDAYECADGEWITIGAIEPQFRRELIDLMDLPEAFEDGDDPRRWADLSERMAAIVAEHPRSHWNDLLAGSDACYAPVLGLEEVAEHPHMAARHTMVEVADGSVQPAPAPRFSATPTGPIRPNRGAGSDTGSVLADLGLDAEAVADLRARGVVQ